MTWIYLAFSGMFIWSCTAVVDKYALSNKVSDQRFYVAVPAFLQFVLVIILYSFFKPSAYSWDVVLIGLLGGIIEGIFLFFLYTGMKEEELGGVFPLSSMGSLFTLVGGIVLFNETLSGNELWAFVCFIIGGIILSIRKQENGNRKYNLISIKAIKALIIGSIFISIYTLSLRYTFIESDFATGFFYSRLGFLFFGILLLVLYRRKLFDQWKILNVKTRTIIIGNQVLAFGGHVLYFSAIALTTAALVQSVLAVQGLVVLFLASIVSLINSRLVSESVTIHDFIQKSIGIVLVVIALFFLIK